LIEKLYCEKLSLIRVSLSWKTGYSINSELIISLLQRCVAGNIAIIKDKLLLGIEKISLLWRIVF